MYLIYNKKTGVILRYISKDQNPLNFYHNYSQEFKNDLGWFLINEMDVKKYKNCYVKNREIVAYTETEVLEKLRYGKILTEEERVNVLLAPTQQEIQKAQTTIEILSLLEEVNVI